MKTITKNFALVLMMLMVSMMLNAQPQQGDCVSDNQSYRNIKNQEIADPTTSPLPAAELGSFSGLFYYPIDCKFVFTASYYPVPAKVVKLGTTDGKKTNLYEMGTVVVSVKGEEKSLKVYKNMDLPEFADNPETIFIPIKDGSTSMGTTYSHGRYVIINPPADGGEFLLDFNMATNPFQDYNTKFSSVITPTENVMAAPLTVGERKYEDRTR